VGRVEVAVWVCEGLEILRLATAHRSDGFVYGLAVGLVAFFFENGMWQIGGELARGRRQARLVGARVALCI